METKLNSQNIKNLLIESYKKSNIWLCELYEDLNELDLLTLLIGNISTESPDYLKFAYVYKYGQEKVKELIFFDPSLIDSAFDYLHNDFDSDINTKLITNKSYYTNEYLINQCEHNYFVYKIMNFFYESTILTNHTPDIADIKFINIFDNKDSNIPKYYFRYLDSESSLGNTKHSINKYLKKCISLFETHKCCDGGLQNSLEAFYIDFNKICKKFEAENGYSASKLISDFCEILLNPDSWKDTRTEFISVLDEYYANIGTKKQNIQSYSMFSGSLQYIINNIYDRGIKVYYSHLTPTKIKALNTFVSNNTHTENDSASNMIAEKLLEFGVIKFNDLIEVIEIIEYLYTSID